MQQYSTQHSRIMIRAEREMLKHAGPIEVFGQFGTQKPQPQNSTETVVFRRINPWNMGDNGAPNITAEEFLLQEGVNPGTHSISYTDVSATLSHYGVLFGFSSKVELMHMDNIADDMAQLVGETMAEVMEMIRYGEFRGGTNVTYAGGVAARNLVNGRISLELLRLSTRVLAQSRARKVSKMLSAGTKFGTHPVHGGFLVFCSSDLASDIRDLPNFTDCIDYASGSKVHAEELGACEEYRFICSPLLLPWVGAGAAAAAPVPVVDSTGSTNADVYPMIIMAQDAWGHVALKGKGAVSPTILPATEKNHANPMGMKGYVGGDFHTVSVRLNENWMGRIEVAARALA